MRLYLPILITLVLFLSSCSGPYRSREEVYSIILRNHGKTQISEPVEKEKFKRSIREYARRGDRENSKSSKEVQEDVVYTLFKSGRFEDCYTQGRYSYHLKDVYLAAYCKLFTYSLNRNGKTPLEHQYENWKKIDEARDLFFKLEGTSRSKEASSVIALTETYYDNLRPFESFISLMRDAVDSNRKSALKNLRRSYPLWSKKYLSSFSSSWLY